MIYLFLAELLIRLFKLAPKIPKGQNIYAKEDGLSYGLKKNIRQSVDVSNGEHSFTVEHNSLGLRDCEHADKNKYRILAVGDSFTYGWGVDFEDTFLYQLEKWLGVEIIKAGVPGYELKDCRKLIEKYHDFYKPNMVLVCVSPNDALCLGGKHKVTKDGYMIWDNPIYLLAWALFKCSHLARLIIKFLAQKKFPIENNPEKIKKEILVIKRIALNTVVLQLPDIINPEIDLRDFCKLWGIPYINAFFNSENMFLKDSHCNADGNYMIAKLAYNVLHEEIER